MAKNQVIKIKNNYKCAPSKKLDQGTCFTYENLQDIAKEMNGNFKSINIDINLPKKRIT